MIRSEARSGRVLFGIGLVLLAVVHGAVLKFSWVQIWFYPLVWWSFILTLEGLNGLRGSPVFLHRPLSFFLECIGFSAGIWFLFEAYNFSLGNWYYVGVPSSEVVRWTGVVVSFGTVLPGMWVVRRIVGVWVPGWFDEFNGWKPGPIVKWLLAGFGIVGVVGPILFPDYLFPLVWIGLLVVVDLYEYQVGGPSFLGQFGSGRFGPFVAWMIAGGICGFLWEFWNSLATSGWIYTVPYMGEWRIFEMPVLGYLGFLPFAPMVWRLFEAGYRRYDGAKRPMKMATWFGIAGFSVVVLLGMDYYTVGSTTYEVKNFAAWSQETLNSDGELKSDSSAKVMNRLEETKTEIKQLRRLLEFAGMGTDIGTCLYKSGIQSVPELKQTPEDRLVDIMTACREGPERFWRRRVKDWHQRLGK